MPERCEHDCQACAEPLPEGQDTCHYCGCVRPSGVSLDDERARLEKRHLEIADAMREAGTEEAARPVRDRLIGDLFVPRHAELLIEEALRCQKYFGDQGDADTSALRARFRLCLTRLELLAVDDPGLKAKIAILRAALAGQESRERRFNVTMALALIGVLLLCGGLFVYVIRLLGQLFS